MDEKPIVKPPQGFYLGRIPPSSPPTNCPICEYEKEKFGKVVSQTRTRHVLFGTDAQGRPATLHVSPETYRRIQQLAANPPKPTRRQKAWRWLCKVVPGLSRLDRKPDFVIR